MPAAITLETVCARSCCGREPTWRRYWSLEIVSGQNPSPMAASAIGKLNEAMPWPTSNSTPRRRASRTQARTRPSHTKPSASGLKQ